MSQNNCSGTLANVNLASELHTCEKVVEVIRHYDMDNKQAISEISGLAWPTVSAYIKSLEDCRIIRTVAQEDGRTIYTLNQDLAFFVGISIGHEHINFLIINFKFLVISFTDLLKSPKVSQKTRKIYKELGGECKQVSDTTGQYLCFPSLDMLLGVTKTVNNILKFVVSLCEDGIPIGGIGLSVPGAINRQPRANVVVGALNKCCVNRVGIADFMFTDKSEYFRTKNLPITVESNAVLTALAEKEYLYLHKRPHKESNYIAVVYMGGNIEVGLILDSRLHRGYGSAIAHITAPKVPEMVAPKAKLKCSCGRDDCLEARLKQYGLYDAINKGEQLSEEKSDAFSFYLTHIIGLLAQAFNPDLIIFSGKIATWDLPVWDMLNVLRRDACLDYVSESAKVVKTSLLIPHAAVGAAIDAYHQYVRQGAEKSEKPVAIKWLEGKGS